MNLRVKNGVTTMTLHANEQRTVKAFRQLLALLSVHGESRWKELAQTLDVGVRGIEDNFCDPKLFQKD